MAYTLAYYKRKLEEEKSQREQLEEKLKEQKKKVRKLKNQQKQEVDKKSPPYKSFIVTNGTAAVVLESGQVLIKSDMSAQEIHHIGSLSSEEEVIQFLTTFTAEEQVEEQRIEEEKHKAEFLQDAAHTLEQTGDFEMRDKSMYMKGINRSIPELLVVTFAEALEGPQGQSSEVYAALKRFWWWCCLNPRAEVADGLFEFLKNNVMRINKQGFFYALRNVVTVGGDSKELVHFVSNHYNKIKAILRRDPQDYWVFKNLDTSVPTFKLLHRSDSESKLNEGLENNDAWENVGSLKWLYLELPSLSENRYTDNHTQTFDIRIGQKVTMPPEECVWNNQDCGAAGLHGTLDEINYVGCGDTSIVMLVNPMKVVGIGDSKFRCWEYLPVMTVPRDEATELLHDKHFDTFELDEWYAAEEIENLEEKARSGFAVEARKYNFNIPSITAQELQHITQNLEEMKQELQGRVVNL